MFETEAEEIMRQNGCRTHSGNFIQADKVCELIQKGAEFGYNKANEWHYPLTLDKDEQPISDNPIAESYPVEILMYDFETGSKEVIKYDTSWAYYRKDGNSIRRNHIAWQYISIPNKEGV